MTHRKFFGVLVLAFALLAQAIAAPASVADHASLAPVCLSAPADSAAAGDQGAPAAPLQAHHDSCALGCSTAAMAMAVSLVLATRLEFPRPAPPSQSSQAPAPTPRRLRANTPTRAPPFLS